MPAIIHGGNNFVMGPIHHQAAVLLAQGKKHGEVAEFLGVGIATISQWKLSDSFKQILNNYRQEIIKESMEYAKQQIGNLHVKAVDKLDKLLDAQSESVQLGAVREILERGPLRVLKQGETAIQPGQVILSERMIIAMRQVSSMVGDQEMSTAIEPIYQEVTMVEGQGDGSQVPVVPEGEALSPPQGQAQTSAEGLGNDLLNPHLEGIPEGQ